MVGECRPQVLEHSGESNAGAAGAWGSGGDGDQVSAAVLRKRCIDEGCYDRRCRRSPRKRETTWNYGTGKSSAWRSAKPFLGSAAGTWAVPVAARVVRDTQVRRSLGSVDMTANAAVRQSSMPNGLAVGPSHMAAVGRTPSRPAMAEMSATATAGRDNGSASSRHLAAEKVEWAVTADRAEWRRGVERVVSSSYVQ